MSHETVQKRAIGRDLALLAALALLFLLPGISSRDLWNPDEPRYTEVAREMLDSGQFLVPHLNGELYTQKPPLHFWSIAFFGWLRGGVDEVAARLPPLLAAITATACVYLLGSLLFGRSPALLSALTFVATNKILWQGRHSQIDMTLCALVLCAVTVWVRCWVLDRWRYAWLFFVFTGLATLAKGPAGFLPPLFSILVFLAIKRDHKNLRAFRIGRGILVWLFVAGLWFVPAVIVQGREYFDALILQQSLNRYFEASGHIQPWYYYLTTLPADFMPFTFLLPAALLTNRRSAPEAWRPRLLFLWVWIGTTVAFFSVSAGKRSVYVLALLAPLALIVGSATSMAAEKKARAFAWSYTAIAALLVATLIALPKVIEDEQAARLGAAVPGLVTSLVIVLALGGVASTVLAWRRRAAAALVALSLTLGLGLAAFVPFFFPYLNQVKSARQLALELKQNAAADEPYAIYPIPDAAFLFYSERFSQPVHSPEMLMEFLRQPGRVWLLIERDDYAELDTLPPLVEVARDPDWQEGHLLLTTPPWPRGSGDDTQESAGGDTRESAGAAEDVVE